MFLLPAAWELHKSKNHQKVITRHVWEDHKEKVRQNRLFVSGKNLLLKKWLRRRKKCWKPVNPETAKSLFNTFYNKKVEFTYFFVEYFFKIY